MWQILYLPANGASLGSFLSKNGCLGAKTGKMGLWHLNLQTFFDEVIIFELVGDDVKMQKHFRELMPDSKNIGNLMIYLNKRLVFRPSALAILAHC